MRRTVATLAFTAVLASAAVSFAGLPVEMRAAAPEREAMFLVPINDGYGVAECLASGGECGQIVANAWCETQGYARATTFGPASPEDVTGSVQRVSTGKAADRPIAVTCTK
jgi:hypothetical protein